MANGMLNVACSSISIHDASSSKRSCSSCCSALTTCPKSFVSSSGTKYSACIRVRSAAFALCASSASSSGRSAARYAVSSASTASERECTYIIKYFCASGFSSSIAKSSAVIVAACSLVRLLTDCARPTTGSQLTP
eukprot:7390029-Prymnesium_polylepis.1